MLNEAWLHYDHKVLARDAPHSQRDECRLAFYSGAIAMFFYLTEVHDPARKAFVVDVAVAERLKLEFEQYFSEVAANAVLQSKPRARG